MTVDAKAVRRYNAGVERALGLWDATNEWADYIAFLSRLAKALQASPPDAEVPFKPTLAKYLALCLKPTLPSGVHQKALEIYNLVFSLLGKERLAHDLPIWLPGVSHTLTFATLTTRPLFLSLFDDHLLKLSSFALRPALRAIILSLLPGIEEENSEDFDRTLNTINRLRESFAKDDVEDFFWQSLFLASTTSTSKRPGALVYLTRELPNLGKREVERSTVESTDNSANETFQNAVRNVTTPEPGLLVRCFATGLQDDQPLVQRGFLDLLVSHLPLNAPVLQSVVPPNDLDILVAAAMSVVLRRDMSLNRRLWTWFLGREDKRESSAELTSGSANEVHTPIHHGPQLSAPRHDHFAAYGLQSVIRSLESMLRRENLSPVNRARPFRIMLSLMDRWSIGKQPVEALFVPAMQYLQRYQTTAPSQSSFDEVFRSANVFFDAIEPQLITSQLFTLLVQNDLDLIDFILANFNLQEEEMTTIHLPMLCLAISEMLLRQDKVGITRQSFTFRERISGLLAALLALIPPSPAANQSQIPAGMEQTEWLAKLKDLYEHSSYVKKAIFEIVPPTHAAQLLLRNLALIVLECLHHPESHDLLGTLTNSLVRAISRMSDLTTLKELQFGQRLQESLKTSSERLHDGYHATRTVARIVDTLSTLDTRKEAMTEVDLLHLVPGLIDQLWKVLAPSTPQFHVEAVEQIWSLRGLSEELLLVDSKIADLMCNNESSVQQSDDQLGRFSILWTHTRFPRIDTELFPATSSMQDDDIPWATVRLPVLSIIDGVDLTEPEDRRRMWLNNLPVMAPILKIVYEHSKSASGTQVSLLGLHRLRKVVTLVQQSATQRKEFFGDAGFSEVILSICSEKITSARDEKDMFTTAASILRILIGEVTINSDHKLVISLIQVLPRIIEDSPSQGEVLELLQAIFAKHNVGIPPIELIQVLINGISSKAIDTTIDKWVTLLCNILPLYSTQNLFANMIRLTTCFCDRVNDYFLHLQQLYERPNKVIRENEDKDLLHAIHPEKSVNNLLAGLEYVLARAHTHLVDQVSGTDASNQSSAEKTHLRSIANHRLTVILCMQDTIKLCGQIWAWRMPKQQSSHVADGKSFTYISSRLRARTRRILEHLSDAEPQECLETLMGIWVDATRQEAQQEIALNLMQSLDGARPKFMMPATFNAIYNRTNPSALDQSQKSSLSVNINASELLAFLIAYTTALEDDLLEEIWSDCTAFLREVLANPMPHRQILLKLLEFVAVLCQKMENTNFGEVIKMRRELSDLCARLFTAIFTIRPAGLDAAPQASLEPRRTKTRSHNRPKHPLESGNAIQVLCDTLPIISSTLGEQERLNLTISGVAANVIGPILRSKQFPQSVNIDILRLALLIAKSQPNGKAWKKDVFDTFNDNKFFQSDVELVEPGWMPLVKQLWLTDKNLMSELMSRLTPPTTAGIMFGVGATAARIEADRKTQLNLRRIALLMLAADVDAFVVDLAQVTHKLEELLTATPSSSPSSSTRGDIYLVLRAVTLTFTHAQLVSIWSIVDVELRELFANLPRKEENTYTGFSHLQGAKLLDLLLLLKPEEFQLHEWLFVTDSVDAVYPPHDFQTTAIADQVVSNGGTEVELPQHMSSATSRTPWLCSDLTRTAEDPQTLLRPFFRQLSIHAFEDTYSLQPPDLEACRKDLLADLFVDG